MKDPKFMVDKADSDPGESMELLVELPEGEEVRDISPHCDSPFCRYVCVYTNRRHFLVDIVSKDIEECQWVH